MRVKKYLALIFAAILATTMLTACPWEKEEDETDDASSVPVTSTDTSQDEDDEDGGGSGGDTGPTLKPTVSISDGGTLSTTVTHDTAAKTYTVKVTATPHENHYVQSLTVTAGGKTTTWNRSSSQVATFAETGAGTDITIETTDNETFTVSGIPEDATTCNISAKFAQYYTVTVTSNEGGTVACGGGEQQGSIMS